MRLHLNHQQLSQLPSEIFDKPLEVKRLNLSNNNFKVLPPEIGKLKNLEALNLYNNQLDSLPPELGQLKKLVVLNLSSNNLTQLPSNIGQLTQLTTLNLQQNHLTTIPKTIGKLKQLRELRIDENQLTELPRFIGQLQNLVKFTAERNQLKTLPTEIGNMHVLQDLRLADNQLTTLPENIGRLRGLTLVDIMRNQFTTLPECLCALAHLKTLRVGANPIEHIPDKLEGMIHLDYLDLHKCQLKELPASMGQLKNLAVLYLFGNPLQQLPPEMGQLSKLRELIIYDTALKQLPPEIGQLNSLRKLDIGRGILEQIPTSIGQLAQLEVLELRETKLKQLPKEIGQLPKLDTICLQDSTIEILPEAIGQLPKCRKIYLQGTAQLKEYPTTLALAKQIRTVTLTDNQLGAIPMGVFYFRKLAVLVEKYPHLKRWLPKRLIIAPDKADILGVEIEGIQEPIALSQAYFQWVQALSKWKEVIPWKVQKNMVSLLNQTEGEMASLSREELLPALFFPVSQLKYQASIQLALQSPTFSEHPLNQKSEVLILGKTVHTRRDIKSKLAELNIASTTKITNKTTHILLGKNVPITKSLTNKQLVFFLEPQFLQYLHQIEKPFLLDNTEEMDLSALVSLLVNVESENVAVGLGMLEGGGVPQKLLPLLLAIYKLGNDKSNRQAASNLLQLYGSEKIRKVMARKHLLFNPNGGGYKNEKSIRLQTEEAEIDFLPIYYYCYHHFDRAFERELKKNEQFKQEYGWEL